MVPAASGRVALVCLSIAAAKIEALGEVALAIAVLFFCAAARGKDAAVAARDIEGGCDIELLTTLCAWSGLCCIADEVVVGGAEVAEREERLLVAAHLFTEVHLLVHCGRREPEVLRADLIVVAPKDDIVRGHFC